jgi:NAD+ kinase
MRKNRPATSYKRVAFVASDVPAAQRARRRLVQRYGDVRPETADVVVALGGDGLMLATLQRFMNSGKPIYGMHRGTVGFLMNEYSERDLHKRLAAAHVTVIHPLLMQARDAAGRVHRHRAINEVSLFRQSYQAARLRVFVDGKERLAELMADGIMLATPAGSTAYNLSTQGPIIPIGAPLLALTPIRQTPGGRGRRSRRSALGARGGHPHGSRYRNAYAVRSGPQPRRAHHRRTVRALR